MVSLQSNCRLYFSILGGAWESTITFFTLNLKDPRILAAQTSRLAENYSDVCKVLFQKTSTNKSKISVEEQEQALLSTLSQEKNPTSFLSYLPQISSATFSVALKHRVSIR